jgi:hypothetical protein
MPAGDRAGPAGMGPMSGRAAGYCAGHGRPGYESLTPGRGFGRGRGFGNRARGGGGPGWRHWFRASGLPGWRRFGEWLDPYPTPDPDVEKQALRTQAEALQAELDWIRRRLGEFENPAAAE